MATIEVNEKVLAALSILFDGHGDNEIEMCGDGSENMKLYNILTEAGMPDTLEPHQAYEILEAKV